MSETHQPDEPETTDTAKLVEDVERAEQEDIDRAEHKDGQQ